MTGCSIEHNVGKNCVGCSWKTGEKGVERASRNKEGNIKKHVSGL